ncbi:nitrate- and nitrite sensing domain-containing protein [Thiomicrospira sp. ALE5]|uniref:nitrate- and nitrite sensing domain-containing protein n=1 Tax=Thiomicrospira sp. ALE5 TaxID=748650 RepID=UPI0008E2EF63|nr:nitrate- and nitrite sensing domain-containing protein [Thiomicrospira sp. ALE5]SFR50048.1 ANTAR domain-containing protein [Thiomicrospira sp. ALE5]
MMQAHIQTLIAKAQASQHLALSFLFSSMDIVRPLRKLVHDLQLERGSTSLLLINHHADRYATKVNSYRAQFLADEAQFLTAVNQWQLKMEQHALPSGVYVRLAHFLERLNHLQSLREQIDTQTIQADQAIEAFSQIISAALSFVFELAEQALDAEIARAMLALFNFMQAKELAGQERALGVVALGLSEPNKLATLTDAIKARVDQQQQAFQLVRSFATSRQLDQLEQLKTRPYRADLDNWRKRIAQHCASNTPASLPLAEGWFDLMTERIDGFQALEDDLISYLQIISAKKMAVEDDRSLAEPIVEEIDSQIKTQVDEKVMRMKGVSHLLLAQLHDQAMQLGTIEAELIVAKQTLLDRRFIERAKAVLMIEHKYSEQQAHQFLRDQAMKTGMKMVDLAKRLLKQTEKL